MMAIRATDFALRDFCLDDFPFVNPNHLRNGTQLLTTDVIKLKADYIGLATVDAGIQGEVRHQPLLIASLNIPIAFSCFEEIIGRVIPVVSFQLKPSTNSAISLP